ncbi:MAG: isoleucine--tRNA ligase [Clostridiales bacterium]|nr:isoleucine--tRNA ligase [Clostridiales bacterium]
MYRKVDTGMNFLDREKEVLDFWKENRVFERVMEESEGRETFTFYDGPPTANGKPHIGHILTRVMKDIIPRYKTMQGYDVSRKAGWDTHGLPVELEVEKLLGLDGKKEIETYGIEPFIGKCKESVWKYKSEWEKMSDRVGFWADMENPYVTYHDDYIESEWWALKEIWKKGLLYQGHKIVPYCPRCGTALASHEVAQGYKDVKEKSVYVKFRVKGEENKYFLAWTTTPWTLPSNVALCVNPQENYAEIKVENGEVYIMAEALVSSLFETYETLSVKTGKEYEYVEYEPLFPYAVGTFKEKGYYVTCDTYVTLTDGTGIVHNAPAFGEDDARVGKIYNLPFVQLVNDRGCFKENAGAYAGMFVKDADKFIIKELKENGMLLKDALYEHSYPFCWRCDTPLLYYARHSWFIRVTAIKDELIASNNSVNWLPESIGTGRMGNFLENVIDWGLSRERYWGTPLPVWKCADCGEIHVIGSKEELRARCGITGDIELHRPYLDSLTCTCEKCGGKMQRVPEVIDCWFDSGSMPFAQYHYPFENKELFEKRFPADFISEAVDQTRGWFYTLLTVSTLLFGKSPFKNCIVLGHVNDKNGIKMSKHKGNVVDPWTVLDKQGADAVRWYFYTSSAPWIPSRFGEEAVSEAQRKFMGTLWNTYAFFTLYAEIDGFDPSKYDLKKCALSRMDRWVLSKLHSLVKDIAKKLDEYNITDSARAIADFTDELSNWYVRRGRERYWGKDMTEDKKAAYTTLYHVLTTLAKVIAPYVPFMAESIYQNLVPQFDKDAPLSVHLCSYPQADETLIDKDLEKSMRETLEVVVLGRAARNASSIKNRQPLSKLIVSTDRELNIGEETKEILKDELNVKDVEVTSASSDLITYELKPQLKTLGPKYGKKLNDIRAFLSSCNGKEVVDAVSKGAYTVNLGGEDVILEKDDLLITVKAAEGFAVAEDRGIAVAMPTALTPELIREGNLRELISKVQTMRKEAGFEVTDHVLLSVVSEAESVNELITLCGEELASAVLADGFTGAEGGFTKELEVNGAAVTVTVKKV